MPHCHLLVFPAQPPNALLDPTPPVGACLVHLQMRGLMCPSVAHWRPPSAQGAPFAPWELCLLPHVLLPLDTAAPRVPLPQQGYYARLEATALGAPPPLKCAPALDSALVMVQ
jgi:hypothetical protein